MNKPLVLIVMIVASCFCSIAEERVSRTWFDEQTIHDDTLVCPLADGVERLLIDVRAAMHGVKESKGVSPQSWGLEFVMADRSRRQLIVGWGNTMFGDFTDERFLSMEGLDGQSTVRFTRNVDTHDGPNSLIVETDGSKTANVYIGDDLVNYAGTLTLSSPVVEVRLFARGKLDLMSLCIVTGVPVNLDSGLDSDAIAEASVPGQEAPLGVWHYFDRDNDAAYAVPGGDYDLLVVRDPESDGGAFLILYLGGARVNAAGWRSGMIKGRLTPTHFKDRYDLKWYDAGMEPVDDECHASVDGDIFTIQFPLHHAQLRYSR